MTRVGYGAGMAFINTAQWLVLLTSMYVDFYDNAGKMPKHDDYLESIKNAFEQKGVLEREGLICIIRPKDNVHKESEQRFRIP